MSYLVDLLLEQNRLDDEIRYLEDRIEFNKARIRKIDEIIKTTKFEIEYSVTDISILLSVEEETVRRWIRDNDLIASLNSKKEGYIIKESDFEKFLMKHKKYYNMVHKET